MDFQASFNFCAIQGSAGRKHPGPIPPMRKPETPNAEDRAPMLRVRPARNLPQATLIRIDAAAGNCRRIAGTNAHCGSAAIVRWRSRNAATGLPSNFIASERIACSEMPKSLATIRPRRTRIAPLSSLDTSATKEFAMRHSL